VAAHQALEAAHFEGLGVSGPDRHLEATASVDGSIVVILSIWDALNSRLIILRPATGELRALSIPTSEAPRLSPDGRTIAVSRSRDPAQRGVWVVDLADGSGSRVVEDPAGKTTSRPLQWSRDGKTLAIARDANGTDPEIAIVDTASHALSDVGPGRNARWRGDELYFWSERAGTSVRAYDPATASTRVALPVDEGTVIDVLETRPASSDIVTLEHAANARRQVVLHGSTTAVLVPDAEFFIAMWWSRDGDRLFAWTTFNGTETLTEVIGGGTVLQFCRRVKVSPPCP
jgi:Tol biopolymer transport system component